MYNGSVTRICQADMNWTAEPLHCSGEVKMLTLFGVAESQRSLEPKLDEVWSLEPRLDEGHTPGRMNHLENVVEGTAPSL